jgi:hypothetical protein
MHRVLPILALTLFVVCGFAGVRPKAAGAATARAAWAPPGTRTGRRRPEVASIDAAHGWAPGQSRTLPVRSSGCCAPDATAASTKATAAATVRRGAIATVP